MLKKNVIKIGLIRGMPGTIDETESCDGAVRSKMNFDESRDRHLLSGVQDDAASGSQEVSSDVVRIYN
jgi:hypothetical protein